MSQYMMSEYIPIVSNIYLLAVLLNAVWIANNSVLRNRIISYVFWVQRPIDQIGN